MTETTMTATDFESERDALWAWARACDPAATREEFDARFDAELAAMKADETADE